MTCSSCVSTVERGVQNIDIILIILDAWLLTFWKIPWKLRLKRKMRLPQKNMARRLLDTVESLGFDCKIVGVSQTKDTKERKLQHFNIQFEINPPLNGMSELDSLASKLSTIVRSSANKDYPDCIKTMELVEDEGFGRNTRKQGKIDKMSLTVEFSDLSVGIRTLWLLT